MSMGHLQSTYLLPYYFSSIDLKGVGAWYLIKELSLHPTLGSKASLDSMGIPKWCTVKGTHAWRAEGSDHLRISGLSEDLPRHHRLQCQNPYRWSFCSRNLKISNLNDCHFSI